MYSLFFFYGSIGAFALRIALAAVFIVHGWQKLRRPHATIEAFNGMGFRPGVFWGMLVGLLEFFGGIALVFGFLAQTIAFFFAVEFLVVLIWRIATRQHFVGGWELDLLIFGAVLFLLLNGAGAFAAGW